MKLKPKVKPDAEYWGIEADEETAAVNTRWLELLDSEQRKRCPMSRGLLDYFPDALAMVSHVSWVGNEKHNPGEDVHWARGKSMDQEDCLVRHITTRDEVDVVETESGTYVLPHRAMVAWRALADLQQWMEEEFDLAMPTGAK